MVSPLVFLSYSHADRSVVDRLADDLGSIGVSVWKDTSGTAPGRPIPEAIETALQAADYLLLCLSDNSLRSNWVKLEYGAAVALWVKTRKPTIVPLLLTEVIVPPLLANIRYVDFRGDYQLGWKQLSSIFPPAGLRVGGSTGTGVHILKSFLGQLRRAFPSLPINETIDISEEIVRLTARPSSFGLDAGVVGERPGEGFKTTVDWVEVTRDRVVLIVPPTDPLWGVHRLQEADLGNALRRPGVRFVSRPKASGMYRATFRYLSQFLQRSEVEQLLGEVRLYSVDQVCDFVAQGIGMAILPSILLGDAVAQGKVWAVELPGDTSRSWYGLWPKNRERTQAAEHLVSLFKSTSAEDRPEGV